MYRKLKLRRTLLRFSEPGPAYVPFIGDGDIAAELYGGFSIFGADLDSQRIQAARERLAGATLRVWDCNAWPFPRATEPFTLADFDAYSEPYASFRSFWEQAPHAEKMVLFFTDGHRQGIVRSGSWTRPDGKKVRLETTNERRAIFNKYFGRYILPWFKEYVEPYEVKVVTKYLRGMQLYWGAVIEHGDRESVQNGRQ
jgi:hypothetical protein